jgi:hypothetical protein
VKSERFDVGSRSQGDFILELNLCDKLLDVKWNLLHVYGVAQDEFKNSFIAEFASFCSKNSDPYKLGGDFNILRYPTEKNKNFSNIDTLIFSILLFMLMS